MNQIKNKILFIEDELPIRKLLSITLVGHGFKPVDAENGQMGIRMAASIKPDLILIDLGLPDIDGTEVIKLIREWSQTPIIVCSVRSDDRDIIKALELGADDYVVKPFNPDILVARIKANLRKAATQEAGEPNLSNGNINMDLVRHEVLINNKKEVLTPKEYELLRYFMLNRGKMLTHKQLLKDIWGNAHGEDIQYLRVYVSQLREKLEKTDSSITYIVTEPGIGYRMEIIEPSEKLVSKAS